MKKISMILIALLVAAGLYFTMNKEENTTTKEASKPATVETPVNNTVTAKKPVQKEEAPVTKAPIKEVASPVAIASTAPAQTSKTATLDISNATKVKMKIKAKEKAGIVKTKVGISHDMLTYDQAKKKGLEANFITHITALAGDRVVYDASTSQFLSKNPLMKFSFEGKKGEELTIIYQQLKGETFFATKKIK